MALQSKGAGVLVGKHLSFLDHLAPLCVLMGIPLVCTEPWMEVYAQTFYPDLTVQLAPEGALGEALCAYDTLYAVEPCRLHRYAYQFGGQLLRGAVRTVMSWHGNSDKYRTVYWAERYAHEDVLLIYGEHQRDFLREKGVWERIPCTVSIGNVRWAFYKHYEDFFDARVAPYLFPATGRKTLLYAPTWSYQGGEDDSPFFATYTRILDALPDNVQVLVKPHPYVQVLAADKIEALQERYAHNEQVRFVLDMPLIYPLLKQCAFYLGDYSSIGYDFLHFDRPLFFLAPDARPLARVGSALCSGRDLRTLCAAPPCKHRERAQLYAYAYDPTPSFPTLRTRLTQALVVVGS